MFCPECGTQIADGAAFCPKCGTKLISNNIQPQETAAGYAYVGPMQQQPYAVPVDVPKKKKSKKLPIILGIVAMVVVAAIVVIAAVIVTSIGGGTEYIVAVKQHEPYKSISYANVMYRYINSPDWEVRKDDDVAYVNISGTAMGTDNELVITIKVAPNPNDADFVKITPVSVTIDGKERFTKSDAVEFLLSMFKAYDGRYDDLSKLLSLMELLDTPQTISLSETYTNEAEGISFKYPGAWVIADATEFEIEDDTVVGLVNDVEYASGALTSTIEVSKLPYGQEVYGSFYISMSDKEFAEMFAEALGENVSIIETSVVELDGIPARMIVAVDSEGAFKRIYIYGVGSHMYRIFFGCEENLAESYDRIFKAIIDSYKITVPADTSESSGLMNDDETSIFADMAQEYIFSSGAGAWATYLQLFEDGSFFGTFSDSDMGDIGEEYPDGTVYMCNFSGKFSEPEQISDYVYSMRLEYLETDETAGEVEYEYGIKYIYSEAYGLDGADEFLIYCPGMRIDDLPEDFMFWMYAFMDVDSMETLPCYAIYNIDGDAGFIGIDS